MQRSSDVSDVEVTLGPVRAALAKARRSGFYWRLSLERVRDALGA
ncbi:hypothetical protein [Infirmifilum sp. NZ]|nr:hypothetical protein [Infirmifilum sp. NZ]